MEQAYGLYTHIQANKRRSIALLIGLFFLVYLMLFAGALAAEALMGDASLNYLIARARQMDLSTGEGKQRAVNFLLPYVQKIPNRLLRSEWATRIAQQLRLDEPVLRAALSKAAAERRSEVKIQPELVGRSAKPVERRLIRMLADAEGFRQ